MYLVDVLIERKERKRKRRRGEEEKETDRERKKQEKNIHKVNALLVFFYDKKI